MSPWDDFVQLMRDHGHDPATDAGLRRRMRAILDGEDRYALGQAAARIRAQDCEPCGGSWCAWTAAADLIDPTTGGDA